MIGQDFDKIQWHFIGLDLLEPNAMLGDLILFLVSIFFASKIKGESHKFLQYWKVFFYVFGFSFLIGGFGHLLFNYTGLWGKYPSWILGMIATFYLSKAMISLWPDKSQRMRFTIFSKWLLIIGVLAELSVFMFIDLSQDQSRGLLVPSLISGMGLIFALVYLGIAYQRKIDSAFKYFWMAALVLLPNTFIQNQKINLAQWFDRNDFSHVLLLFSIILYFVALVRIRTTLVK